MKFRNSRPPDSMLQPDSRPDSRFGADSQVSPDTRMDVRRQLLKVVLAKTIQKTGVPAAWLGAELNPMVTPDGEEFIEIRLSLQVDEPRFLTYMSTFQADFERRLLEVEPDARRWLAGIAWKIAPDPVYELEMPKPEFWELVLSDRLITARQKGAAEWDKESLAHHFSDTNPGGLEDFADTRPPDH